MSNFSHEQQKQALLSQGFKANLAIFRELNVKEKANGGLHYQFTFNVFDDAFPVNKKGYQSKYLVFHAHFAGGEKIGKQFFYESLKPGAVVEVFYKVNAGYNNLYAVHLKANKSEDAFAEKTKELNAEPKELAPAESIVEFCI